MNYFFYRIFFFPFFEYCSYTTILKNVVNVPILNNTNHILSVMTKTFYNCKSSVSIFTNFLFDFLGNEHDAATTFVNSVDEWKKSLNLEEQSAVYTEVKTFPSYYDSRGGINATTDETGNVTLQHF